MCERRIAVVAHRADLQRKADHSRQVRQARGRVTDHRRNRLSAGQPGHPLRAAIDRLRRTTTVPASTRHIAI
jgi:hypothetical protein